MVFTPSLYILDAFDSMLLFKILLLIFFFLSKVSQYYFTEMCSSKNNNDPRQAINTKATRIIEKKTVSLSNLRDCVF